MTTPPPADNPPDDAEPAAGWAPPDAPPPTDPGPPTAPGPPPWAAPPHGHGPPPMAVPQRTNRLAIAALVTGLLGLIVLAVAFGIAALLRTGRRGEKGKGLAIGGLVASAVWVIAAVIVAATTVTSMFSVNRDDEGRVTKSGKVLVSALREGDCFKGPADDMSGFVTALPCTEPHDSEVIATSTLPEEPYPTDMAVEQEAARLCYQRTLYLQKSRRFQDLEYYNLWPDELAWTEGDRMVTCTVRYVGPGTLTSPLAATVDPGLKTFKDLTENDCIKTWTTDIPVLPVVPCDESHDFQVFGVFEISMDGTYGPGDYPPYPGEEKVEKEATRGCDKRAEKVFKKHPPRVPLDGRYVWPEELDWYSGDTRVVCLVTGLDGPLKRSVVPR